VNDRQMRPVLPSRRHRQNYDGLFGVGCPKIASQFAPEKNASRHCRLLRLVANARPMPVRRARSFPAVASLSAATGNILVEENRSQLGVAFKIRDGILRFARLDCSGLGAPGNSEDVTESPAAAVAHARGWSLPRTTPLKRTPPPPRSAPSLYWKACEDPACRSPSSWGRFPSVRSYFPA
jgi:hypothetical protein